MKWEYKLFGFNFQPKENTLENLHTEINELGLQGWEAVNLNYLDVDDHGKGKGKKKKLKNSEGFVILFKRPLPQQAPTPAE